MSVRKSAASVIAVLALMLSVLVSVPANAREDAPNMVTGEKEKGRGSASISGKVTDINGKHMKSRKGGFPAEVMLFKKEGKIWSYGGTTHVSKKSTYKFSKLEPGSYKVAFGPPFHHKAGAANGLYASEWWPKKRTEKSAKVIKLKKGQARKGINAKLKYEPTLKAKSAKGSNNVAVTLKANKKAATGKIVVYKGKKKVASAKLNKKGKATLKLPKQKKGVKVEYKFEYSGSKSVARQWWPVWITK